MAVTASVQPESAQIVYARSNFPHLFQLCFAKAGMDHIVQNWPGSNLDGVIGVWPNTSGLEASWCAGIIRPSFWQDATGLLLVSHFQTQFHSSTDVPDNTVQNQPGSDLILADCVRFWPNGSGPKASQCARIIRPASGQCFPADPDWVRIGSGMFTGVIWHLAIDWTHRGTLLTGLCSIQTPGGMNLKEGHESKRAEQWKLLWKRNVSSTCLGKKTHCTLLVKKNATLTEQCETSANFGGKPPFYFKPQKQQLNSDNENIVLNHLWFVEWLECLEECWHGNHLTVGLCLGKGDYPENLHTFCTVQLNKLSSKLFMCFTLGLVLAC